MNLGRTLAISRRIAEFFRRDHRTLALLFAAPILIMALLGWVIRDQHTPQTRLAVVDQTGIGAVGDLARNRIADAAKGTDIIFEPAVTDEQVARTELANNQLDVALVLPSTLPTDVLAGRAPHIIVITQGLVPTDDAGRLAALQGVLRNALGVAGPQIDRQTIYGNPNLSFFDAFAPALVGFVVFFLVFILTGISFLRERVGGTLERLLATPVRRLEIVVGYSVGFAIFATLQVALVLAFVLGALRIGPIGPIPEIDIGLGVPSAGSPALAFVITLLLAISAVNLGIFLSTFARTEFQILQFIPIVIVPQALLSGIAWPVDSLPGLLGPIARLLPMTYGIEGLREVLIKGSGLESTTVQLDLLVLAGIAVVLAALAAATIRREIV